MERNNNDILLLDGKCGLCNRLALFIAAHMSSHKKIKFLPIDSNDAQELIKTFPSYQQKLDTVYLYKNGNSYTMSSAAIRCLLYLKWYWKIWFPFFWLIPLPIRNLVYKIIAKYRHHIFSKPEACSF